MSKPTSHELILGALALGAAFMGYKWYSSSTAQAAPGTGTGTSQDQPSATVTVPGGSSASKHHNDVVTAATPAQAAHAQAAAQARGGVASNVRVVNGQVTYDFTPGYLSKLAQAMNQRSLGAVRGANTHATGTITAHDLWRHL